MYVHLCMKDVQYMHMHVATQSYVYARLTCVDARHIRILHECVFLVTHYSSAAGPTTVVRSTHSTEVSEVPNFPPEAPFVVDGYPVVSDGSPTSPSLGAGLAGIWREGTAGTHAHQKYMYGHMHSHAVFHTGLFAKGGETFLGGLGACSSQPHSS